MITILENVIVFLIANPVGFMLFTAALIYLQYLLAKNIYESDPNLQAVIDVTKRGVVKSSSFARSTIARISLPVPGLKPVAVPVKIYKSKHKSMQTYFRRRSIIKIYESLLSSLARK